MRLPQAAALVLLTALVGLSTVARVGAQDADQWTIGRGRAGTLRVGMSADAVTTMFGPDRVRLVDLHLEGSHSPALEIRLDGSTQDSPSLVAELFPPPDGDRVWRIHVFDRPFRTADGLGVGSTLGEIRARHPVRMGVGEGVVVARAEDVALSFVYGTRWYPDTDLPASAPLDSVLIVVPPAEWMR